MIAKKVLFVLCFYSYIIFTGFACAEQQSTGGSQVKLTQITLESEFSVLKKKLIASKKGSEAICKSDNEYMLSALQEKKIVLTNYDYHVLVNKIKIDSPPSGKVDVSELFQYKIKLMSEQSVDNLFPSLKDQEYLTTYIPLSEAPTSCYIFESNQELDLLCHYGNEKYHAIENIIKQLKQ